ncbi:hypothetical protein EDEG_00556 [Edhazardia aedis USNM 41457]|uniref:UBA domain-containing protein n=1 Tax=Edhazardia aedis (strain USNM 41457) TaxID=1003232 RepID=J8ZNG6_EDHAE|nr:hypothetical protein EDEG_00556 [Edhazardia aedis USNM 41457]|eukprot:EJW01223.1 hypothetical protein EDEG_00556 [Edhazardia aedis USNM 41457]
MLTINFKGREFNIEFNPDITLVDLKKYIGSILNLPFQNIRIYYNNLQLTQDHNSISSMITDNTKLTVVEDQPDMFAASMPMVANLMKDPNWLKNTLEIFPELKNAFDNNKDLQEMVKSGAFQEEMERIANDPNYYKEVLKNADLNMAKIENMPGGTNLLNSLMSDVHKPIMNAFDDKNIKNVAYGERRMEPIIEPIVLTEKKQCEENLYFKFIKELKEMRSYGFEDVVKNVEALKLTDGNIEQAMLYLAYTTTEP